jgi:hypothetical protein
MAAPIDAPTVYVNSRETMPWATFQRRIEQRNFAGGFPRAFSISGEHMNIGGLRIEPNYMFPGHRYNLSLVLNGRTTKRNVIVFAEELIPNLLQEMAILRNHITERQQDIENRRVAMLESGYVEEVERAPRQLAYLDAFLMQAGGSKRRKASKTRKTRKASKSRLSHKSLGTKK